MSDKNWWGVVGLLVAGIVILLIIWAVVIGMQPKKSCTWLAPPADQHCCDTTLPPKPPKPPVPPPASPCWVDSGVSASESGLGSNSDLKSVSDSRPDRGAPPPLFSRSKSNTRSISESDIEPDSTSIFILDLGADPHQLKPAKFGRNTDLEIVQSVIDPDLERLYIHVKDKELGGIYFIDMGDTSPRWQRLDIPIQFDTTLTNTIYSMYLNQDQLMLVTLAGVYDIQGQIVDEIPGVIKRSGQYAITSTGRIYKDGETDPIRLPPDAHVPDEGPYQIESLESGDGYATYCVKGGAGGILISDQDQNTLHPCQALMFSLNQSYIVYVNPDGEVFTINIQGQETQNIQGPIARFDLEGSQLQLQMSRKNAYFILSPKNE